MDIGTVSHSALKMCFDALMLYVGQWDFEYNDVTAMGRIWNWYQE